MKPAFTITDPNVIRDTLQTAAYGTLALSGTTPYAVPVNLVYHNDTMYFHGSAKGKKMRILAENNAVSCNVTTDHNIIPSYFSSTSGLACPATTFFKSITIDGHADIIAERDKKAAIFSTMMTNLQPEGQYIPFDSEKYTAALDAVAVVAITAQTISAKFKFGQNLSAERFDMIIEHLQKRGRPEDVITISNMQQFRI